MSKVAPVTAVFHQVHGEHRDVGGPDDPSDRERPAKLFATDVQSVAEHRGRQRCVDEPGRDQVHPDPEQQVDACDHPLSAGRGHAYSERDVLPLGAWAPERVTFLRLLCQGLGQATGDG